MSDYLANFSPGGDVPEPNGFIVASRNHRFAVRGKGQRCNVILVAAQLPDFFPAANLPQPDTLIATPGGHCLAVRRKSHCLDSSTVAREAADLLARLRIPQTKGGIIGPRSDGIAIGGKRQRINHASKAKPQCPQAHQGPRRNRVAVEFVAWLTFGRWPGGDLVPRKQVRARCFHFLAWVSLAA